MSPQLSKHNPLQVFNTLWHHRDLIAQLVKRDILTRYRGSFGGIVWLLLTPLLMLSLYTVVFGIFMKVQFPGATSNMMFSLIIYVALIILNFFSECVSRSPTIIASNPNYVKKIVFPLEIFPWVIVGSALFHTLVNSLILALFCLIILGKVHLTILLFPFLLFPLMLMTLGLSWFLCSAGVYVRDIAQMMGFILQIIMYLSPVFYSISTLQPKYQKILLMNPLTYIIEQARALVLFGHPPQWQGFVLYLMMSIGIAWLGYIWFQKTKDGFADVL